MGDQLMDIVLPRLAKRLYGQVQRFRSGKLNEEEFSRRFAALLQKQYVWLARKGVAETDAALVIHAAVLVLTRPGLCAAAVEMGVPPEVVETRAISNAAADVAEHYQVDAKWAFDVLSDILARYGS
jgi:hypothetical protein